MGEFGGFPLAGLDFYEDLAADNSRTFWNANKDTYLRAVRTPMTQLATELEPAFAPIKIFRPYRDVRFAKDKTPYKTAQGAVARLADGVGWYVQLGAPGLHVGGGFYRGTPAQLAQLRATIDHEVRGAELSAILDRLSASGCEIGGERLKTKPKGYSADHPRIELLRHKSMVASIEFGSPDWLTTPAAADRVRNAWETLRPLVEYLAAVVGVTDE